MSEFGTWQLGKDFHFVVYVKVAADIYIATVYTL